MRLLKNMIVFYSAAVATVLVVTCSSATADQVDNLACQLTEEYKTRGADSKEWIAAILKRKDGSYYFERALSGRHDEFNFKFRKPKSTKLVGIWHSHRHKEVANSYFSAIDTSYANAAKVPFYMARKGDNLKVYRPRGKLISSIKARKLGLGKNKGYSHGNKVKC